MGTIHLPKMKAAATGEDLTFARQDANIDPEDVLLAHFCINKPDASQALFTYQHKTWKGQKSIQPLTKDMFLKVV